ncbi:DNA helicase-2/ATP-dependent DNA helicase PcrA [Laceyella sediminis]|uniref:DNA 3'-5' helicase n=1 Tax=Laceyella sediminis TaxID=573074 RepID=A0ABX5EMJ6_9BACL|nr:UvrD-helicase domain-containing protein [Laceyella sediminis]PRZ12245.1 DNA helicase-2/ATP-dependent DNA helicase PcrA [Laceyella sediminis]
MKSLEGLNEEQIEAVETIDRNTMVFAGPGTGKTRIITQRIAYLFERDLVPPSRKVLAITFTNKAANEMRSRVQNLGIDSRRIRLGTFHNLCQSVLRAYGDKIEVSRDFTFVSPAQRSKLILSVLRNNNVRNMKENVFANWISKLKNSSVDYGEYLRKTEKTKTIGLTSAAVEYETRLRENNMIDFDDAILLTVTLLKNHSELLWLYHNAFPYLLIDEMQDTNRMQLELIRLLGESARNVMAVADDDQSIYGWRGALPTVIREYIEQLNAHSITLVRNYRSPQIILDAANSLIEHNDKREKKTLIGRETEPGDCLEIKDFTTAIQEAEWVADKIKEIHKEGIEYKKIIVLYRSRHSGLKIIDDVFIQKKIPFRHFGKNFNKVELFSDLIKESLKLIVEPSNDLILESILESLIPRYSKLYRSNKTVNHYEELIEGKLSVTKLAEITPEDDMDDAVKQFAKFCAGYNHTQSYLKIYNDLYDLLKISTLLLLEKNDAFEQSRHLELLKEKMIKSRARNIIDLIGELDLQDESNYIENSIDEVGISTFHAAKGLEYKAVFIIALEDDIVPARYDEAEERRGLYVAMTRSESKLYMSYAQQRDRQRKQPSRFFEEIDVKRFAHKIR